MAPAPALKGARLRILEDILGSLRRDALVTDVTRGLRWTAVTSLRCGLASTTAQRECSHHHGDKEAQPGPFAGKTVLELGRLALSKDPSVAAIGLAAINSALDTTGLELKEVNAAEVLAGKGAGKIVSVIGHFPFTDELRKAAAELWVMEKTPLPGDRPEVDAEEFLPRSAVVAISSTTLLNGTFPGLLKLCPKDAFVMLLGPTTPISPVLFDHGVDMLSGSLVENPSTALRLIREGADFRQLKRSGCVRLVCAQASPKS